MEKWKIGQSRTGHIHIEKPLTLPLKIAPGENKFATGYVLKVDCRIIFCRTYDIGIIRQHPFQDPRFTSRGRDHGWTLPDIDTLETYNKQSCMSLTVPTSRNQLLPFLEGLPTTVPFPTTCVCQSQLGKLRFGSSICWITSDSPNIKDQVVVHQEVYFSTQLACA